MVLRYILLYYLLIAFNASVGIGQDRTEELPQPQPETRIAIGQSQPSNGGTQSSTAPVDDKVKKNEVMRPGAGIILIAKNQGEYFVLLALDRDRPEWGFSSFGGKQMRNTSESPSRIAIRETSEETRNSYNLAESDLISAFVPGTKTLATYLALVNFKPARTIGSRIMSGDSDEMERHSFVWVPIQEVDSGKFVGQFDVSDLERRAFHAAGHGGAKKIPAIPANGEPRQLMPEFLTDYWTPAREEIENLIRIDSANPAVALTEKSAIDSPSLSNALETLPKSGNSEMKSMDSAMLNSEFVLQPIDASYFGTADFAFVAPKDTTVTVHTATSFAQDWQSRPWTDPNSWAKQYSDQFSLYHFRTIDLFPTNLVKVVFKNGNRTQHAFFEAQPGKRYRFDWKKVAKTDSPVAQANAANRQFTEINKRLTQIEATSSQISSRLDTSLLESQKRETEIVKLIKAIQTSLDAGSKPRQKKHSHPGRHGHPSGGSGQDRWKNNGRSRGNPQIDLDKVKEFANTVESSIKAAAELEEAIKDYWQKRSGLEKARIVLEKARNDHRVRWDNVASLEKQCAIHERDAAVYRRAKDRLEGRIEQKKKQIAQTADVQAQAPLKVEFTELINQRNVINALHKESLSLGQICRQALTKAKTDEAAARDSRNNAQQAYDAAASNHKSANEKLQQIRERIAAGQRALKALE